MRDREQLASLIKDFRADDRVDGREDRGGPARDPLSGPAFRGLIGGDLARVIDRLPARIQGPGVVDPLREPPTVATFRRRAADFARVGLEIGCARGEFALALASNEPETLLLASDVRSALLRRLHRRLERRGLRNLFAMVGDVRLHLPPLLAEGPLFHEIYVLFPDPWWKRRHRRRRLFQEGALDFLATALLPGGRLYIRSDVEAYRDEVLRLAGLSPDFLVDDGPEARSRMAALPPSRRELELAEAGLSIFSLVLRRRPGPAAPGASPPSLPTGDRRS